MARRRRRRLRLEIVRREHRRRHVLHLRHHRKSQGRGVLAPLQRPARAEHEPARHPRPVVARHGAAGGAAVPRQWLVARLLGADVRRQPGDAGNEARRRLDLRAARCVQGHLHRRGADGVAGAARPSRGHRRHAAPSRAGGDRRLRLPARDHPEIPGRLRGPGDPRLGHDRDEPARQRLLAQAGICRTDRRGAARHPAEAGPSAVPGRDDHRGRCRAPGALGRQVVRAPQGARARRRQGLFQGRRRQHPRQGRLFRYRRRRHHGPLRLHADHRPFQGRDQVRRRMDLLDRPGKPRHRPSQGGRGGGDRRAPSQMGRAAAPGHRHESGRRRRQGGHTGLHAGQDRHLVDAR